MWRNLAKRLLVVILIILPFQLTIANITPWSKGILNVMYFDEMTVVIFIPVALLQFYKKKELLNNFIFFIFLSLSMIVSCGFASGIINGNSPLITLMGTFDYVKNFLVILIYAALLNGIGDFNKIFRLILIVAVFLGIVAFVQEIWAVCSHYALGMNIFDNRNYLFKSPPSEDLLWTLKDYWRYGIYRTPSLMFHPNNLGLYSLLILTIYLYTEEKINLLVFLILFISIFLSVSRMIYSGFLVLVGFQILAKNRRWVLIPAVPIVTLLIFMAMLPDLNMIQIPTQKEEVKKEEVKKEEVKKEEVKKEDLIFRAYASNKAKEIWNDNPALGIGPGMFGGVISIKCVSPVYKKYSFSPKWFEYMKSFGSIDQFWPQSLAEIGSIGTIIIILFFFLLIMIFLRLYRLNTSACPTQPNGLYLGLAISTVYICMYTFGSGLNDTSFLFTYSALAGLGLRAKS